MIAQPVLTFETFALHRIESPERLSFSADEYSRFKFGHGALADTFGRELARAFMESNRLRLLQKEKIVLLPSPYDSIPTASNAMARAFRTELNAFLAKNGKKSLLESKIHRYKTYSVDYGNLSFEERLRLISGDTYHLDREFLRDGLVLLIDDIRITGSHELMIRNLIKEKDVQGEFIFLYFAELVNRDIPADFENFLNYHWVKDIEGVISLVQEDFFTFNTRVIKYILCTDARSLDRVLETFGTDKLLQLCDHAFGNNYHLMDEYKSNLERIQQHIDYGN